MAVKINHGFGMIKFTLKCARGHGFESWFQSSAAFDALKRQGHLLCPECGDGQIEKALMAPAVKPSRTTQLPAQAAPAPEAETEARLQALRAQIEANSDYVGDSFASEARAMYLGDIPSRPIYGEAPVAEAKALVEEGVPVVPLPFVPTRKAN